ncbi:MAG: hypothetical protein EBX40_05910 [Gammaproteobacteria bacterium]|nr:hypothetical protein [Gammaproteobacteria bacterium]
MASYMNEQEQVDALKSWFKTQGKYLVLLIVAAIIALLGWQHYMAVKTARLTQASIEYSILLDDLAEGRQNLVRDEADHLMRQFEGTPYGNMAALILAGQEAKEGHWDQMKLDLMRVIKNESAAPAIAAIAKERLATLYCSEGNYQEALGLLEHAPAGMEAVFAAVRGDALVGLGKYDLARIQYQIALDGQIASDLRQFVQMKLEALP